ncbi:hypothetical protein [Streptomyces coerulescens]|uniref:Uncharacterized protein n=1 Tax=Streptomyces coerulescens TaxID=29304 RepID=A0ABW0CKN3_STRCD
MSATTADRDENVRPTYPYRRETYLQETYLRETYLRAWRRRIATSTFLTASESRTRRPLPLGPAEAPEGPLTASVADARWLRPRRLS